MMYINNANLIKNVSSVFSSGSACTHFYLHNSSMSSNCNSGLQNNNDEDHDIFSHYSDNENPKGNEDGSYSCTKCDIEKVRYRDGRLRLRNPHIERMSQDILYHLALGTGSHDLVEMFGDIKFVCMGGSAARMESFAHYIMNEIGYHLPPGTTLEDISRLSHRYSMYKVGPVLSINHGMGPASIGILLHEIIKLMYYAKVKDPIFFRIGTCGGIGVEGGTVIISDDAIDEMGNHYHEQPILGKLVRRPTKFDKRLVRELKSLTDPKDPFKTVTGTTMCANDFYEGQGRVDGAFCDYTEDDKMAYLEKLRNQGVKNIEMEAVPFSAATHHAGIKAAIVCVALLNRMNGDQVSTHKEVLLDWQTRPQILVGRYIKRYLETKGHLSSNAVNKN